MRVIVIGAGLGGLTLAQGLLRAGIDVAVYERDAPEGRPQGISLHFDDRGAAALRGCLPPEHAALAEALMGAPADHAQVVSEVDGRLAVTGSRPLDGKTPRPRPGRTANRPLLRAVLLCGLEGVVRFGAAFEGYETLSDGTVEARFADGSTDRGSVLVGADGIGSTVRSQLLPRVRVLDTGLRMLMGATPLTRIPDPGLLALLGEGPSALRADGRMLSALRVLRFAQPPATARDRCLPALRSPVIADAEGYLMWAMPTTDDTVGAAAAAPEAWDVARRVAADRHPVLDGIVGDAWPDVTVPLRIGMIPPMRAWRPGAVTLIGDAVHVAPGVGGNLAMRDAHWLRDALVRTIDGELELRDAIGGYEATMRRESFPGRFSPRRFGMRHLMRFALPIARRRLR